MIHIQLSSWSFFPHIDSKKVCSLVKNSVTKFSVILSVQYTLAFIFFLTECFPKVWTFMRIIWYYGIIRSDQRWYMGLWIRLPEQRQKPLPLRKIRVCYFFRAVHHSKTHVISHPVIAAILDVILNILQRWKKTCLSNSPNIQQMLKTIRK